MSKPAPKITRRERPAQHAASKKLETAPIRVRATRLGYYDEKRRRPGDVFTYKAPLIDGAAVLPSWLEEADAQTPFKETGAQAALAAATEDVRAMSGGGAVPAAGGDDLGI